MRIVKSFCGIVPDEPDRKSEIGTLAGTAAVDRDRDQEDDADENRGSDDRMLFDPDEQSNIRYQGKHKLSPLLIE